MKVSLGRLLLTGTLTLAGSAYGQTRSDGVAAERRAPVTSQPDSVLVGARVGIVDAESIGNNVGVYGATADYVMSRNFLVGGSLDYWSNSTGTISDNKVDVNDVSIGANSKFVFTETNTSFRPYAMAGVALHRVSISYSQAEASQGAANSYAEKDQDVSARFGVDVGGGVLYQVQRSFDLNGNLVYRKLADESPDLDQLQVSAGLAYRL
jgi:opacity protein-like surface antigen